MRGIAKNIDHKYVFMCVTHILHIADTNRLQLDARVTRAVIDSRSQFLSLVLPQAKFLHHHYSKLPDNPLFSGLT